MHYQSAGHSGIFLPSHKPALFAVMACLVMISALLTPPAHADGEILVQLENGDMVPMYQGYHAVVIGVEDYQQLPKLRGAAQNARRVAGALENIGFKTTLVLNPTANELKSLFEELPYGIGAKKKTGLIIYYTGRTGSAAVEEPGAVTRKVGYLMPVDGPAAKGGFKRFNQRAYSMLDFESMLYRIRCDHVLTVLDCKFKDAITPMWYYGRQKKLNAKSLQRTRQFIRSLGNKPARHQRFTDYFVSGLNGKADLNQDTYLSFSELGYYLNKNLAPKVKRKSNVSTPNGVLLGVIKNRLWSGGSL
jgi:hypothetical protein